MKSHREAWRHLRLLAGILALSLGTTLAPHSALAVGEGGNSGGGGGGDSKGGDGDRSGGSSSLNMVTCPRGQIYNQRSRRCVQVRSEVLTDQAVTDYAYAL